MAPATGTSLLGYWVSGLLFVAPMPRAERTLEAIDRALRIDAVAAAAPRWVAEVLEAAYVGVYPLIPIALAIHLWTSAEPSPDHFWTVILVTDFVCFGFLPWVQTRPPRAFRPRRTVGREDADVQPCAARNDEHPGQYLSQRACRRGGRRGASGRRRASGRLWLWSAVTAALISAGAVLGRYHYAADVLAGWGVAVCVWVIF